MAGGPFPLNLSAKQEGLQLFIVPACQHS
jgi:hypothetical protein